ncbi:MAG TPA: permease [Verrucomicrobiota bacterium]|nr:permease [Verrucomicrobiota bacterium]
MSAGSMVGRLGRLNGELKIFAWMLAVFLLAYYLPLSNPKVTAAIQEAFRLLQWYARNHTLACVVPALFIAGAVITFLSQASVMRYLGPNSNKLTAYSVASVSGGILAVCSCSVLPVFAGIYRLGAGLGPASAFLYSGPAINILAIFLTARVLGFSIGLWRAVGAVAFAFVIGLLMATIFRKEEVQRVAAQAAMPEPEAPKRPLWKTSVFFVCLVAFLVFSDWYNPGDVVVRPAAGGQFAAVALQETRDDMMFQLKEDWAGHRIGEKVTLAKKDIAGVEEAKTWVIGVYHARWYLAGAMGFAVLLMTWRWMDREEVGQWMHNTWDFAKLLVPLLFGGVFVVGFIGALIPETYVATLVGDNSLKSNLVSSVIGAFWYFATLTEIPICEALGKLGMAPGPMLALLLAGPAVSLPNMLVLRSVMGTKKMLVFTGLTVVMATITGMVYGAVK